ncbi:hypothetical protein THAOC_05429 [Thalassiosira oceanica]|uniref:FAD-binding PCMH-type domain-containing protein n=1 Tax=Thalassiosira oceanica TaxID=159749 RepID=K0TH27_THAOC|nr:hypothetical protein THAOC_05429 [Thalassiosira oceanica]|eukprot:EJK72981.1 hypothetical protein THAOC_05429 [Thalassiosira oceanica]
MVSSDNSQKANIRPVSTSLIDVGFSDFATDCHPEFVDNAYPDRTNHGLIDKPSGLCVSQLFCAYEKCWPRPDPSNVTQAQRLLDEEDLFLASYEDLSPEVRGWLSDPSNPSLNLPSKLLFPAVWSDVVAAIEFASENGLEVSVKNSGHSFMGASTKKDTLHINMNRFEQYAPSGIVDCGDADAGSDGARIVDLAEQPCRLAAARNKPAYIRVGGGENWDKVYRAVDAANAEQGNKYHVVGGAAGTVSPMGWTFQGGLAGTQGGRKYGFGVDQVLQVEMVLPNGQHVKFGPVEWEDASSDGFIVPKTTSVGGMCRLNPEEPDESLWEWADCPEGAGIDFDDLGKLHPYLRPRLFGIPGIVVVSACAPEVIDAMGVFFESFRLRWVLAPDTLNVSQAESDACGMADAGLSILMCYGDGAYGTLVERWESYTNGYYDPAVYGVSLDDALACPETIEGTWSDIMKYPEGPYKGQVADVPYPTIRMEFIYVGGSYYLAFGSGTASASDQANSLSEAHRQAAFKALVPADNFYGSEFASLFNTTDADSFPSFKGANHVGNTFMGPMRDDWTRACPPDLTQEERAAECVSIQETLWGTEALARLERIKEAIDPNYMFDCEGCVGNNRVRRDAPTNSDTEGEASTPAGSSESNDDTDGPTFSGTDNNSGPDSGSVAHDIRAAMLVMSAGALLVNNLQ